MLKMKNCHKGGKPQQGDMGKHHGPKLGCIAFALGALAMGVWGFFNFVFYHTYFYITNHHHARVESLQQSFQPSLQDPVMVPTPARQPVFERAEPREEVKEPQPQPNYTVQAQEQPQQVQAQQPQGFYAGNQYVIPVTQEQLDAIMRAGQR